MDRRRFLSSSAAAAGTMASSSLWVRAALAAKPRKPKAPESRKAAQAFELEEVSIAELQEGMRTGRWTAVSITEAYLHRIEAMDGRGPALRSILETNPDAPAIARDLDLERRDKGVRGPLHGIPVLLKDNLDTADRMTTTAGSLALEGSVPQQDSTVAARLRAAGAILLAKTNLSEWANIRSTRSSSGWSGRGGQCRNPYVLDRNPCGSSSGSAAATSANFTAVAIGTETDGSIVCPSNNCGLVGLKPTVGLVSRAGIIPISSTQDTAGPMTRNVTDAAVLLGIIAGHDPRDPATAACVEHLQADYTKGLDAGALQGAKLGVARQYFGFHSEVDRVMEAALEALRKLGAVLVDPVKLPADSEYGENELTVLLYEFKAGLAEYLAALGPSARVRNLDDVIRFNQENAAREMPYFGQELFLRAQALGPLTDFAYRKAHKQNLRLLRETGIDELMRRHNLDAIVGPTGGPAWTTDLVNGDHFGGGCSSPPAVAGYPHITVPAGDVHGLPVGLSFFGRAWSEAKLLGLAFAFEQGTKHRRAPAFRPTLAA